MKRFSALISIALFSSIAAAQALPPVAAPPLGMAVGDAFQTLFVTCGTTQNPECPRYLAGLGQTSRIHYVVMSGRTSSDTSVAVIVKQVRPDGSEPVITLARIQITAGSDSSIVIPLTKPIVLGPTDQVGVVCPTSSGCSVMATFGIELIR